MDIIHLKYLLEIVNQDFNLTAAAQSLFISQSALSQFIKKFEQQQGFDLFQRKNGRIVGLSSAGKNVYAKAIEIVDVYQNLENVIERESQIKKGLIKLGGHPTFLRLFFTKFLPKFMIENPKAYVEIVEAGSLELRQMLLDEVLDIAILTHPTGLNEENFEQYQLMRTEAVAFMDPKHPLAEKRILSWSDLEAFPYITYTDKYTLNHSIASKVSETAKKNLLFTSGSWDYMIECAVNSEIIAILPTAYFGMFKKRLNHIGVIEKRFNDPIPYIPMLVRPRKERYTSVESFVFENVLDNFYDEKNMLKYNFLDNED